MAKVACHDSVAAIVDEQVAGDAYKVACGSAGRSCGVCRGYGIVERFVMLEIHGAAGGYNAYHASLGVEKHFFAQ